LTLSNQAVLWKIRCGLTLGGGNPDLQISVLLDFVFLSNSPVPQFTPFLCDHYRLWIESPGITYLFMAFFSIMLQYLRLWSFVAFVIFAAWTVESRLLSAKVDPLTFNLPNSHITAGDHNTSSRISWSENPFNNVFSETQFENTGVLRIFGRQSCPSGYGIIWPVRTA
jgi:hypothetical protein